MAKTALLTIDSTKITPEALVILESILYGTPTEAPRMPLPDEIVDIIKYGAGSVTADPADAGTYVITRDVMTEDSQDPGTYTINSTRVSEDPADPGTYLVVGA